MNALSQMDIKKLDRALLIVHNLDADAWDTSLSLPKNIDLFRLQGSQKSFLQKPILKH